MGYWSSFCSRNLVLPKLLYFTLNVLCYSTYTFTSKYFKEVWNISYHYFGYMLALCALSFTGSIIWTMLADKTGQHKLILLLTSVGYCCSFMLLRTHLFINAPEATRLAFVSFCYGLSNFFTSALYPLLDNRVFVILVSDPRFSKEIFGRQRLYGTIGQSAVTVLLGYLLKPFGYTSIFVVLGLSTLAFVTLIIIGVPSATASEAKSCPSDHPSNPLPIDVSVEKRPFYKSTLQLISTPTYVIFLFIILIASTSRAVAGNHLPQYFDTVMKLPPHVFTVIMQTRIITEVLVFFFGKQMLLFLGVQWMLFLGQFTGFLRVFAYAILPTSSPWTTLPALVELLKGLNNGFIISAGVRYAHDCAPQGAEATAQGFFAGIQNYLAMATSGLFSGVILQQEKDNPLLFQVLFRYTALLSGLGLVIYSLLCLVFYLKPKIMRAATQSITESQTPNEDEDLPQQKPQSAVSVSVP